MAFLFVRVENPASLPLNEFYDYQGLCYGLSRSRLDDKKEICINPEDFYEASAADDVLHRIPVFFFVKEESGFRLLGWYKKADIRRKICRPCLFLEGNLIAASKDAVFLSENDQESLTKKLPSPFGELERKFYEVVEEDDFRFSPYKSILDHFHGENRMELQAAFHEALRTGARRDFDLCMTTCNRYARLLHEDKITDLYDLCRMKAYAQQAINLKGTDPDGYYYLAMAEYQLGNIKPGLKAINKAIRLEPDASDLPAQKALLLCSLGNYEESAQLFEQVWEKKGEEDYLLWEGRVWMMAGRMEKGYECFRRITDQEMLKNAGIELSSMERKWPFVKLRNFNLKSLLKGFR